MKGNCNEELIERFQLINLNRTMAPLASSMLGQNGSNYPQHLNHLSQMIPTCSSQQSSLNSQIPQSQINQRARINRGSSFPHRTNGRIGEEYRNLVPKLSTLNFSSSIPNRTTFHEVPMPIPGSGDSMPRLGMRDVAAWLKSLRLHKYTALFSELTYDQMMNLDENTLERRNVTKGARKKILQSIEKLIQRPTILRENEQMLFMGAGKRCLNCAIACLRQTLGTPIRPYGSTISELLEVPCSRIDDQNLPGMLCRLLFHVHCLVFRGGLVNGEDLEDEYLFMILNVYDRILSNEAFTAAQKERVLEWKKEARKFVSPAELRRHRVNTPHTTKCDSCLKENQERTRSEQRTIYRNLMSVRDITNFPKSLFDIDLTSYLVNQQLMLLLLQNPVFQQQQKEQELLKRIPQVFHQPTPQTPPPSQIASTSYLNTFTHPNASLQNQSTHSLFGPQGTQMSNYGLNGSIESQQQSNIPRPIQGQSSNQSRYYPNHDQPFTLPSVRPLCSTSSSQNIENSLFSDVNQMPIGMWNGAAAEMEANKKKMYEPFSPCDSTSGYSSSGSERGSAGSPEDIQNQRRQIAPFQETPSLLKADIPQVNLNWIYGIGGTQ